MTSYNYSYIIIMLNKKVQMVTDFISRFPKTKMVQTHSLSEAIDWFDLISLEQLNNSMALMERKEKKYIITEDMLPELFANLKEDYRVLTINNIHIFSYDNVYMDTNDYMFYTQHEAGIKSRTKVRTRKYVDSNLNFFEYKQKEWKQLTKYRYETTEKEHGKITIEWTRFFQGVYKSIYGESLNKLLTPSLHNQYKRVTFCSKNNEERITIDFNVEFSDPNNPAQTHKLENIAIIESKATTQPAQSAPLFERLWIQGQKACSKYCLWLLYLGKVTKNDHFLWTLDAIIRLQNKEAVPTAVVTQQAIMESFNNVSLNQ